MADLNPVAFLSYVRADDDHDRGRITYLRERLEGEVKMHTGKHFKIFQDRTDIKWGQNWRDRLDKTLLNVTFLIPVITPSYFQSDACRDEFEKFRVREKQLGENRLILPIYYLSSDEIDVPSTGGEESMGAVFASRNWADWRGLRFKDVTSPDVEMAVAEMAKTVKSAVSELKSVIEASEATSVDSATTLAKSKPVLLDAKHFSPKTVEISEEIGGASARKAKPTFPYYAYTTEFDEIVRADALSSPDELDRLGAAVKVSAKKFRKEFSEEIASAEYKLLTVKDIEFPSVTILVDNSGSMRGKKISNVAVATFLAAEFLESVSIRVEVLGFTTRAWRGGRSAAKWIKDGRPESPGRLNDLRHIVYKDFESKIEKSENCFGLMLREGILKENIDGEALLWAHERNKSNASRKSMIVVISDGAPVDDSTLTHNPSNFLISHLVSAINWIENNNTKVYGVGIEYNIDDYYKNGLSVAGDAPIFGDLVSILPNWIEQASKRISKPR